VFNGTVTTNLSVRNTYCAGPGKKHIATQTNKLTKVHTNILFSLGFVETISLTQRGVLKAVFLAIVTWQVLPTKPKQLTRMQRKQEYLKTIRYP